MEEILRALSALRIPPLRDEFQLQEMVADLLSQKGISYVKEARLAPRCRVDFLCGDGVVLEIKRGRPVRGRLLEQLRRYAALEDVRGVILVVERTADLPRTLAGKPCRVVALNRLWGVAVG